jgi:hypothetical protein
MLNTAADVAFKMAAVDDYDSRYPDKLIYPDRKWEVAFLGEQPRVSQGRLPQLRRDAQLLPQGLRDQPISV